MLDASAGRKFNSLSVRITCESAFQLAEVTKVEDAVETINVAKKLGELLDWGQKEITITPQTYMNI